MEEREIPDLQGSREGQHLHAFVFGGVPLRPLTPAESKRARYVQNLKNNLRRFDEALSSVEHLAAVCELSQEKIAAIRKAKEDALAELSQLFDEKLKAYDARIIGGSP